MNGLPGAAIAAILRVMNRLAANLIPIAAGLLALTVSACSAKREPSGPGAPETRAGEAGLIADGRAIADAQCASCHAVGLTGESPRSDAPPLRRVLADYAPDALAEDFREQIHVGHRDMPDFDFGIRGTDALLAYLVSIQDAEDEPAR